MAFKNPYQAYQTQAATTAKPEDLTQMLYEGMVKFIRLSKIALTNGNIEESNRYNLRAQDILSELMITLKEGYTVSEPLLQLYEYMRNQLIQANIHKKVDVLEEVEGFAVELAETWGSAMKLAKSSR